MEKLFYGVGLLEQLLGLSRAKFFGILTAATFHSLILQTVVCVSALAIIQAIEKKK